MGKILGMMEGWEEALVEVEEEVLAMVDLVVGEIIMMRDPVMGEEEVWVEETWEDVVEQLSA